MYCHTSQPVAHPGPMMSVLDKTAQDSHNFHCHMFIPIHVQFLTYYTVLQLISIPIVLLQCLRFLQYEGIILSLWSGNCQQQQAILSKSLSKHFYTKDNTSQEPLHPIYTAIQTRKSRLSRGTWLCLQMLSLLQETPDCCWQMPPCHLRLSADATKSVTSPHWGR